MRPHRERMIVRVTPGNVDVYQVPFSSSVLARHSEPSTCTYFIFPILSELLSFSVDVILKYFWITFTLFRDAVLFCSQYGSSSVTDVISDSFIII